MDTTTRQRAPGAGRKRITPNGRIVVSVSMTPEDLESLKAIDDNASKAIRMLIQERKMNSANWWDVLGNQLTASAVIKQYNSDKRNSETLAEWIERQSRELWGDEHDPEINYALLADNLRYDAQIEQRKA